MTKKYSVKSDALGLIVNVSNSPVLSNTSSTVTSKYLLPGTILLLLSVEIPKNSNFSPLAVNM